MCRNLHGSRKQRGAALLTAMLVVTLAVVIVSGLLWRQQLTLRSVENQRLGAQAELIVRAGIAWGRLILADDARQTGPLDHLGEVWAMPLPETQLSAILGQALRTDNAGGHSWLSGHIEDAQGRFNLTNLLQIEVGGSAAVASGLDQQAMAAYARLLLSLGLDSALAGPTAQYLLHTTRRAETGTAGTGPRPLDSIDSLLAIPGYTPDALERLRPCLIILPTRTALNVNTAAATVLTAVIPKLLPYQTQALERTRATAYFRDLGDFGNRLHGIAPSVDSGGNGGMLDVQSHYFLVYALARHERARRSAVALLARGMNGRPDATRIVWVRELEAMR